jgi:hypothetical protein
LNVTGRVLGAAALSGLVVVSLFWALVAIVLAIDVWGDNCLSDETNCALLALGPVHPHRPLPGVDPQDRISLASPVIPPL